MRFFGSFAAALVLICLSSAAQAANSSVPAMTAGGAITDTDLFYCVQSAGTTDRKCTPVQLATYLFGKVSSDVTCTSGGACALKNTGPGATGPLGSATVAPIITIDAQGRVTALASGTITPAVGNITGLGTGVGTALGVNVGTAGAFVVLNGAGGTPSSMTLTNATGLPIGGITGLGTGVAASLAAALNGSTGLIGALTPTNNNCVVGNGSAWASTTCPGGGVTFANPTGTAGPTTNNGVAATAMRSDATPAVQQGSASQKGIVQVDGTTIAATGGVISAVNNGTVTSVGAGCGTTTGGSPITTSGTVSAATTVRPVAGTTDTVLSSDCGGLINYSSASSIAVTLPQAGTTGFASTTFFNLCTQGAGAATITPTTSTIGGASTLVLSGANATNPICVTIVSDGTNYQVVPGSRVGLINGALKANGSGIISQAACADLTNASASCATDATNAANISTGTLGAARGGAGTIAGALKGSGSGVVSQAACADLSNGGTACTASTGTSGASLPFLNGTNTWSGTQTFGAVVGTVTTQSGATYTLASTDCGTLVRFSNASAVTVTIPQGLPVGCNVALMQAAAGQVAVNGSAVTPATLQSAHSYTKTFGAGAIIGISTDATNHATLTGDGA